ncbi:MAG: sugar ABC transporter ATP-binding protein [Acidobacteria bacterium]|nr:sugar ABC transporter ATP-binding protein [Acidobacteriota bacterium]
MSFTPPRLRMAGVHKAFGATQALSGVDFTVRPSEVHALIGENGAGKSTLMKVLSGVHRADAGEMLIDGQPYRPADPLDARRQGVAMIYQELALAPHLSVSANVLLGVEPTARGLLDHAQERRRTQQALEDLGQTDIDPGTLVGSLSVGAQQLVEVARALVTDARIIVFDEPTSSLTRPNVERLFQVIRRLCERGVSVVYISHFLEEVEEVAASFTVLRDGRSVGCGEVGNVPTSEIIHQMVGRKLDDMFPRVLHQPGEPVLVLSGVSACGVESASMQLRRGEILGIAGLIGAGRTELLRAIFGLAAVRNGEIRIAEYHGPASPAERLSHGVGLLSEDRKDEGLALSLAVEDNIVLSDVGAYSRYGWLDRGALRRSASEWIDRMHVKTSAADAPVHSLSGGNQQKVQLARLLHHDCDVLLLDEPTRGIDVASKVQIYEWIGRLAAQGKAVLFVSSYIPELLGVCDTLAVMHRGRLGPAQPVGDWSEHSIMMAATGAGSFDRA